MIEVIVILVVVWVLLAPAYPYSQAWGYRPFGVVGALILLLVLFYVFGGDLHLRHRL